MDFIIARACGIFDSSGQHPSLALRSCAILSASGRLVHTMAGVFTALRCSAINELVALGVYIILVVS
jgi:hypothetical protein